MFTEPADLQDNVIAAALQELWGFTAASLEYRPVGFGSYHWLATDADGRRLYATVDDLAAKRRTADDTTDEAFGRLCHAFGTASALRGEAGLSFVVASLPTATGQVVARLSERYSLVIHPYVAGTDAGEDGEFTNDGDRRAVVDMLIQIHRANVGKPRTDDFVVPYLDTLQEMIRHTGDAWCGGPYAQRAHQLLRAHARDLDVLIAEYGSLAGRAGSRPERMVITHGEPHAGNVIVTVDGLMLVDWDTALAAPPERDLWALADGDSSLLDYYAAATGTEIDAGALSLYRLWYQLAEVGGYLSLFSGPHEDTADTRQSWKELQHFLRPNDGRPL